jgi:HSP20 family protein
MALIRWKDRDLTDPWSELRTLQNEINDLFDFDRFPVASGLFDRSVSPAIDVVEGTDNIAVSCELPGMEQKDIDVTIASNVLTIKGKKKSEWEGKVGKIYRKESWNGSFQRTLPLPATIDSERVSAHIADGILTVTLPKKEEVKPRQITVNVK